MKTLATKATATTREQMLITLVRAVSPLVRRKASLRRQLPRSPTKTLPAFVGSFSLRSSEQPKESCTLAWGLCLSRDLWRQQGQRKLERDDRSHNSPSARATYHTALRAAHLHYGDFARGTTDWLALNEALRKSGLPSLSFISRPAQSLGMPNPAHERALFHAFEEALVQLNRRALLLDQLIEANKRAEARAVKYKDEAAQLRLQRDKRCWLETESSIELVQQQYMRKHNEQLDDFFKLRKEHDQNLHTLKAQERALQAKDLEIAALRRQLERGGRQPSQSRRHDGSP